MNEALRDFKHVNSNYTVTFSTKENKRFLPVRLTVPTLYNRFPILDFILRVKHWLSCPLSIHALGLWDCYQRSRKCVLKFTFIRQFVAFSTSWYVDRKAKSPTSKHDTQMLFIHYERSHNFSTNVYHHNWKYSPFIELHTIHQCLNFANTDISSDFILTVIPQIMEHPVVLRIS